MNAVGSRPPAKKNGLPVPWRSPNPWGGESNEETSVLSVVASERHAIQEGDVEGYLQVFADDGGLLRPDAEVQRGLVLRAAVRHFLEDFRVSWLRFVTMDIAIVGDLAYHEYAYTWKLTPRAGGEASIESGTAYQVLRSGAEGSWHITKEVWNVARPDRPIRRPSAP